MQPTRRPLLPLAAAALGVVFGDLGASPLYSLQEAFTGEHAIATSPANVLGVISLFLWSLVLVVSVKYVGFLMRADNNGEGGILALLALTGSRARRGHASLVVVLGMFGAALLFGDGMITPAISVLSAVEGLAIASPALEPVVLPLTTAILVALFALQRFGSGRVGRLFGPILATWFVAIAILGALALARHGGAILAAVNPGYALDYFVRNGFAGIPILGAVVLCLTGVEALYADIGHFGARPIRVTWFVLVLPALVLSYLGQGAALLAQPAAVAARPFYASAPEVLLYPLVILATAATVIASQALIVAVFSLTRQAIHLGYLPRMRVIHTSAERRGQVYLPGVNWVVMIVTLGLVLGFRSSGALAAAFGFAVAGTMTITTPLFVIVARRRWHWRWPALAAFVLGFVSIDLAFLTANAVKVDDGGWLPLAIGTTLLVVMQVWARGHYKLMHQLEAGMVALDEFLDGLDRTPPIRTPGTAVFLSDHPGGVPLSLRSYFEHAHSLHERVVLLSVATVDVPRIADADRVAVTRLRHGFWEVVGSYGFLERRDLPALLALAEPHGVDARDATYFVARATVIARRGRWRWRRWRERMFAFLHHNERPAADFFGIPAHQVLELGSRVEL